MSTRSGGEEALHVLGYKEKDRHIAHCLEFDLVAEGTTPDEAKDNLADLISSYLQFGKEKGISQFAYHPAPKEYWDRYEEIARKTKAPTSPPISSILMTAPTSRIRHLMQEVKIDTSFTHA